MLTTDIIVYGTSFTVEYVLEGCHMPATETDPAEKPTAKIQTIKVFDSYEQIQHVLADRVMEKILEAIEETV